MLGGCLIRRPAPAVPPEVIDGRLSHGWLSPTTAASAICAIYHGGARQVDHLIATAERPDLAWDRENCRPAHGAPGNSCPVCHQNCNQIRGALSISRARRIIAERAAAAAPPERVTPLDLEAGRDW